ncbi:hypothetical protein M378DRAFT_174527 [Amanita muscaria Koide BX008]|uniref:Uncharacterized protein n=1 Tax=Amanita muscaria (strain Koide BX008) TaxID=946122 RepID=A0A0C2VY41_AMAMK|nr:hypothetical protein M378DRAFT_174570 [Amanita muscaria Koide BX008]KIL53908.1 hypothetical protein M378DRAFT_174527 [Amanita muscaria Koide BX008]
MNVFVRYIACRKRPCVLLVYVFETETGIDVVRLSFKNKPNTPDAGAQLFGHKTLQRNQTSNTHDVSGYEYLLYIAKREPANVSPGR